MNPAAYERLFELLELADLPQAAADVVLAAAEGADALAAHLDGRSVTRVRETPVVSGQQPPRAYLEEIAVDGFRGVGPRARLQFEPAAGLTLVVGRNGCGKSSFSEALEVLLTGTTLRWEERTRVWREGWRNLHHEGDTAIMARFRVDGEATPLELSRSWRAGDPLEAGAEPTVSGPRSNWSELAWERPLEQFRPILSYNELGTMFSTRAAALYEALSAVLGLEDFDAVLATLRQERLAREKTAKTEKQVRDMALQRLTASDDPRAAVLRTNLGARVPDVEAIAGLAESDERDVGSDVRGLATLEVPVEDVIDGLFEQLEAARAAVQQLEVGDADRLDALAQLLETGLAFHRRHAQASPADCPLCGTAGVIDEDWLVRTDAAAQELRHRSRDLREARAEVISAFDAVRSLIPDSVEAVLDRASEAGVDTGPSTAALRAWRELVSGSDADLISRGREGASELVRALGSAREDAVRQSDERARAWQPVRDVLQEWAGVARLAERDKALVATLKQAETWMAARLVDLRRERLAPVVDGAKENWSQLRHESNVALGGVELKKSGNQRYAAFDVAIDGTDASAFGVMSQGELSALAISVFLPRAMLPGSPFGFVMIDDPVQSMDPAKVDGLARVLAHAALHRQVIVFTHDERLPEAVRRLDIAARIMRIQRRARSRLEVVAARPPSDRYIGEALAIAKAPDLPAEVVARVIPGFCRSAIEAACAERIRRQWLAQGTPHAEIDDRLGAITSLNTWLAEALGLSVAQGREIREAVRRLGGESAVEVVDLARRGAHELVAADGQRLAEGARALVRALEANGRSA